MIRYGILSHYAEEAIQACTVQAHVLPRVGEDIEIDGVVYVVHVVVHRVSTDPKAPELYPIVWVA